MYICSCTYLKKCTTPGRESDARKINKQTDSFQSIVHIVRIWLVSLRTTCRLGFCLVYTFNTVNLLTSIVDFPLSNLEHQISAENCTAYTESTVYCQTKFGKISQFL